MIPHGKLQKALLSLERPALIVFALVAVSAVVVAMRNPLFDLRDPGTSLAASVPQIALTHAEIRLDIVPHRNPEFAGNPIEISAILTNCSLETLCVIRSDLSEVTFSITEPSGDTFTLYYGINDHPYEVQEDAILWIRPGDSYTVLFDFQQMRSYEITPHRGWSGYTYFEEPGYYNVVAHLSTMRDSALYYRFIPVSDSEVIDSIAEYPGFDTGDFVGNPDTLQWSYSPMCCDYSPQGRSESVIVSLSMFSIASDTLTWGFGPCCPPFPLGTRLVVPDYRHMITSRWFLLRVEHDTYDLASDTGHDWNNVDRGLYSLDFTKSGQLVSAVRSSHFPYRERLRAFMRRPDECPPGNTCFNSVSGTYRIDGKVLHYNLEGLSVATTYRLTSKRLVIDHDLFMSEYFGFSVRAIYTRDFTLEGVSTIQSQGVPHSE